MFVWVNVMAEDCCGRCEETVEVGEGFEVVDTSSERRSGGLGGVGETWETIGKIEVGS